MKIKFNIDIEKTSYVKNAIKKCKMHAFLFLFWKRKESYCVLLQEPELEWLTTVGTFVPHVSNWKSDLQPLTKPQESAITV